MSLPLHTSSTALPDVPSESSVYGAASTVARARNISLPEVHGHLLPSSDSQPCSSTSLTADLPP